MLISVGERISSALAAMAIHDLGHEAISLTGSQAGIVTDTAHGKAKIVEVRARRIHEALDDGTGSCSSPASRASRRSYDVTTLGRGGSDTTAVALAAALGRGRCEIYTDVEGVFTADPRSSRGAQAPRRHLRRDARDGRVRREGAAARSVEFARNHDRHPARPLHLLRRGRDLDHRGGRPDAREGDDLRSRAHSARRRSTASRARPRRGSSARSPTRA